MKLWLAPLHGITNHGFRNILRQHFDGIDAAIAPFVPMMPSNQINIKKWKDLLPENNPGIELIPQLMGNDRTFLDTALALADLGYSHFNWNLGCPAKEITRKKRGCGLMPYPDDVSDILALVTSKTNFRYSVKIRTGLHSKKEGLEMIRRLNDYPLEFIIIHPRLGIDNYGGSADTDAFAEFSALSQHELIYNGDIVSKNSFEKVRKMFPTVNQWMIGRGFLQNPFLAEEIKNLKDNISEEKKRRFSLFYNNLLQHYNKKLTDQNDKVPGILKELWHYFSVFFLLSDIEKTELLRINSYTAFAKKTCTLIS